MIFITLAVCLAYCTVMAYKPAQKPGGDHKYQHTPLFVWIVSLAGTREIFLRWSQVLGRVLQIVVRRGAVTGSLCDPSRTRKGSGETCQVG